MSETKGYVELTPTQRSVYWRTVESGELFEVASNDRLISTCEALVRKDRFEEVTSSASKLRGTRLFRALPEPGWRVRRCERCGQEFEVRGALPVAFCGRFDCVDDRLAGDSLEAWELQDAAGGKGVYPPWGFRVQMLQVDARLQDALEANAAREGRTVSQTMRHLLRVVLRVEGDLGE